MVASPTTVPGLPLPRIIDPGAPHTHRSSNPKTLWHVFGGMQNLQTLRSDPRFMRSFGYMHDDDSSVVELDFLNKANSLFAGEITPSNLVTALHSIQAERAHPILSRAVELPREYQEEVQFVRESFNELAGEVGYPNDNFADHVRIVVLEPDDYYAYREETPPALRGSSGKTSSTGVSIPLAGLVVLPFFNHYSFFHTLVHEMMHQMGAAIYFMRHVGGVATHSLHDRRTGNNQVIDLHLLRSGVHVAFVDRRAYVYDAFTGFNEGLTELFASEMRIRFEDDLDIAYQESYPLHVMVVKELITQIAHVRGTSKKEIYDRAFNSYVLGDSEVYEDVLSLLGDCGLRQLAKVGSDRISLRLFVEKTEQLEHLLPTLRKATGLGRRLSEPRGRIH